MGFPVYIGIDSRTGNWNWRSNCIYLEGDYRRTDGIYVGHGCRGNATRVNF